jgi:hypothetical protein
MKSNGDPTRYWEVVTPSNTVDMSAECNYLYVGVTGDVTCMVINRSTGVSTATLFKALAVGYHPIQTTRVNATGTTATNILAAF